MHRATETMQHRISAGLQCKDSVLAASSNPVPIPLSASPKTERVVDQRPVLKNGEAPGRPRRNPTRYEIH
jgi:hypothetical protein